MFTGHEFADGGTFIDSLLLHEEIRASFFFTGDFYRTAGNHNLIRDLRRHGHYLGAHSDKHLLYCDWNTRDSLLVTEQQFIFDLADNYTAMVNHGIEANRSRYFLPPYEWYNDSISAWTNRYGLQLVNYTPGTISHADYTTPADRNYRSSEAILQSVLQFDKQQPAGLNGFLLLLHVGAGPQRSDRFYYRLPELIRMLKASGYGFLRVDELLDRD